MKALITLFLTVASITCLAQKQNVFFLKNDGSSVELKDSADFIRVVTEPDSGSELFNVTDVYKSGKKKLVGKSINPDIPTKFEGQTVEYFENGKRKAINNFKEGDHINDQYEYFPNGKLYTIKRYNHKANSIKISNIIITDEANKTFSTIANYDSLDNALVVDSNGYYKGFDSAFKSIIEEGHIKNGKKDSTWKGVDGKIHFIETYKDGEFISGTSINVQGEEKKYMQRETSPEFSGGTDAFLRFLADNIRYPVIDRERGITGRVVLQFVVEKDGKLSNIQAIKYPSKQMADEALRVMSMSQKWMPATHFGNYISSVFTVPINFTLGEEY